MLKKITFPIVLLVCYLIMWAFLAYEPYSRDIWFAENTPVILIVCILIFTYPKYKFSNGSYLMMAIFIFMHTIGGHYTFARVPFDFVNDLFGFERNNYDRFAHFSVGFYAYPIIEFIKDKKISASTLFAYLFAIFAIMSVAAAYEIIEWWFAVIFGGDNGMLFLGSQGDIWDAQKDILCDTMGAVMAVVLFHLFGKSKR